jgi:predicted negative regulator of RcsB-dependent stress response
MDKFINIVKERQNAILTVIGLLVALGGLTYGYSYYKRVREEKAYRALVEALEYFDAPIKKDAAADQLTVLGKKEFRTTDEKWQKTIDVLQKAYKNNSSSGIAPLFLAYQSEALISQGKLGDAVKMLREALTEMSSGPVKSYYEIKLALMLIDAKTNESISEGLKILEKFSLDDKNASNDAALYQLGEYYWNNKKFKEAKNYWNQLLLKYGKQEKYSSPWVSVAKEKLRLIDFDIN